MMAQPGFEQETFHDFLEEYSAQLSPQDALYKMRVKAWDHFLKLGLPTRQKEAYRYIKLRSLFSNHYQFCQNIPIVDSSKLTSFIYPECQESVLVFINGEYCPDLSNLHALSSSKLVILPLDEAMRNYGAFLNNFSTKSIAEEKDPFASLNRALHRRSVFIYIPPKTIVESPLQILNLFVSDDQALIMPRVMLFAGSQSDIKIINSQVCLKNQKDFVNQLVEFAVEEGAHVQYTQLLYGDSEESWIQNAFRANLKKNATLKTVDVSTGCYTARNDYHIKLVGENAEALLNGIWMLENRREAHSYIHVDHQVPSCRSFQLFKGVLSDSSRSSFEGKIMVRQPAQKTEAFQLNHNLLLSDASHADSKPNLEIFADDVKASHGATIGQLDQDQLFYMKTRGLSDEESQNLLIYGFCEEVIEKIPLDSIKEEISSRIRSFLKKSPK